MARRSKVRRDPGRRPAMVVEVLESRQLLAVTVAEYPVALPTAAPAGITDGPGGLLWFAEQLTSGGGISSGAIGSIDPSTKAMVEHPILIAGSNPAGIVEGPDGFLWFADYGTGAIGQVDPRNGAIAEYPTPTSGSKPLAISVADGKIWFTEYGSAEIGSVDPATHAIVEYPLNNASSNPSSLVLGPDGDLWFTDPMLGSVGKFNPTDHTSQEFVVGSITSGIGAGPDGQLWFQTASPVGTGAFVNPVLKVIAPSTGAISSYPLFNGPVNTSVGGATGGITTGPDGRVYFTSGTFLGSAGGSVNQAVTSIGDFDPATKANETSASFPGGGVLLPSIVVGPDGNLWFTTAGDIGEATIVPAGQSAVSGAVFAAGTIGSTSNGRPIAGATVFVDLNGDGTFDPGDPGTVTAADGTYTLTGVPVGTHVVRVAEYPGDVAPPQSVTTSSGGSTSGVNLFVHQSSILLPITYGPMPFGGGNPDVTTAEVTGLYNILLGRAPDAPGLAGWVNLIKSGTPFSAVASAFLHGTPYYDRVIASDYLAFLGRAGTQAEIDYWAGMLQAGQTEEQVTALMLSSDGFSALHPSDGSFVQALYNDLLGRQATASEVAAWESYLTGSSRANLVNLFVYGVPAEQRAAAGFLTTIWGTTVDPTTVSNVVAGLQGGASLTAIASSFFSDKLYATYANKSVG